MAFPRNKLEAHLLSVSPLAPARKVFSWQADHKHRLTVFSPALLNTHFICIRITGHSGYWKFMEILTLNLPFKGNYTKTCNFILKNSLYYKSLETKRVLWGSFISFWGSNHYMIALFACSFPSKAFCGRQDLSHWSWTGLDVPILALGFQNLSLVITRNRWWIHASKGNIMRGLLLRATFI